MKKKILVLLRAKDIRKTKEKNSAIWRWVEDCRKDYEIKFWGRDLSVDGNYSLWGGEFTEKQMLFELKKKIDVFKPDFLYLTQRKEYLHWLPAPNQNRLLDFTSITVPKIYVEVDSQYYDVNDPWYKQFDVLKCREPSFNGWDKVPLFRWSVPEISFPVKPSKRKGIYLIGQIREQIYPERKQLKRLFYKHIKFKKNIYSSIYWEMMHNASCLVCPTESVFGDFTPAKLFEYLSSGAAVLTNCDFKKAGIPELEQFAIKYKNFKDLITKLSMDFTPYHDKAIPSMIEHTHRIRYKELFG